MSGRGKGEQGSALLMIMVAVTVVSVLFGGLYVALRSSHHQALEHELQVQAEFDAQKMMEIGLYYFYENFEDQSVFEELFAEGGNCLEDELDSEDKVCLKIERDSNGLYTKELLTATGVSEPRGEVERQKREIQVDLLTMGGGYASDDGAGSTRPPIGEVPEDAQISPGQSCFYANERLPVRALTIGSDLDLTNGNTSKRLQIEGGLYLPEGPSIRLPAELDYRFININGLIHDEENLQFDSSVENEAGAKPEAVTLGESAIPDTLCNDLSPFDERLSEVADRAVRMNQKVPVYTFESSDGIVTLDAKGKRKETMYQQFLDQPNTTLREAFEDDVEKIIVIRGKLVLDQAPLNSRGYLVIVPGSYSGTSAVEMPAGFVWNHSGAILADTIEWPAEYRVTIRLSKGQVKQYDQSIDW